MRRYIVLMLVLTLLFAWRAYAVTLTIPAAGSTLTESEYDTNNNLVETAVSQLDAVDATKHDKSAFTTFSTNYRSDFVAYTTSVSNQLDLKHAWSAFQAYSTYQATVSSTKVETSAFTSYSAAEVTRMAAKVETSAFTNYSSREVTRMAAKVDSSAFTTYSSNHQFFKYGDSDSATYFTCTSTIPLDDTIPLYTEGQRVTTFNYTPVATGTNLGVNGTLQIFMPTINKHIIVALFVNNTCIDARVKDSAAANEYISFSLEGDYTTLSTAAVPVEMRTGSSDGTTFYVNGNAGSRIFGGATKAHVAVKETN